MRLTAGNKLSVIDQVEAINHDEDSANYWVPPGRERQENAHKHEHEHANEDAEEQASTDSEVSLGGQGVYRESYCHSEGHTTRYDN